MSLSRGLSRPRVTPAISVADFGAVGNGVSDDTAAIQSALNTSQTAIYIPSGSFVVSSTLTTSVADRVLYGPGQITATDQITTALQITGARTKVNLTFDGNNKIGKAISVQADACEITHCVFRNLYHSAGTARGVDVVFGNNDWSVLITDNVFDTLDALTDGVAGNGTGMTRAVALYATAAITKTSIIANNIIRNVVGEEGDAIAVLSGGSGTYYDFPVLISGNAITTWTRRAVKIQANKATIVKNTFRNTYAVDPGGMQHAVSLLQGGDHVVDGNVFQDCKFGGQVVLVAGSIAERVDHIVVTNNVIRGVGAETSNALIYLNTHGEGAIVSGNTVHCPDFSGTTAIVVSNALSGAVSRNNLKTSATAEYSFLNSTNLLTDALSSHVATPGVSTLSDRGDALGIRVSGSTNRSLTLYNWDDALSDGEIVSRLRFHQNDTSFPDAVHASIRAVATGSSGLLALVFCTGQDTAWFRISTSGHFLPESDNANNIGSASLRINETYSRILRLGGGYVQLRSGAGSPEGSVTAVVGSLYMRSDGGAATTLYVKESGTGNTGWVAK